MKQTRRLPLLLCLVFLLSACGGAPLPQLFAPSFTAPQEIVEPDFVTWTLTRSYYDQLDETGRQAYRAIYNAAFSHPEEIALPNLTKEALETVMLALKNDNPQLICFASTYTLVTGAHTCALRPTYAEGAASCREKTLAAIARAKEIAAAAGAEESAWQRELAAHDLICAGAAYGEGTDAGNICGCLVNGTAVCEGYALAGKLVMDLLGIPCCTVSGMARDRGGETDTHMWNAVRPADAWCFLDLTWDDPTTSDGRQTLRHSYFNIGAALLNNTHYGYTLPAGVAVADDAPDYYTLTGRVCPETDWYGALEAGLAAAYAAGEGHAEFRFDAAVYAAAKQTLLEEGALGRLLRSVTDGALERFSYSADDDVRVLHVYF